jgi:hypothetical protein
VIIQPIPYFRGQYVTFSDTLTVDDPTEAFTLTRPDGTDASVPHSGLTRTLNPDTTVTYSATVVLDQPGAWTGQFTATTSDANVAPIAAYVAL